MKSSSSHRRDPRRTIVIDVNPDPDNYELLNLIECSGSGGTYTVVDVLYPDAINYEGRKILVLEANKKEIESWDSLDPHFLEGEPVLARFRPDNQGWDDALLFASRKAGDS